MLACCASFKLLARDPMTEAPSTPINTQIRVIKVPFICGQRPPVVVPLDRLLATLPQKSAMNIPPLKETMQMITNIINGTTLQKVPIVLTNEALSTPLLTRKVKAQQKMIATMIEGRFEPPLKTGIKVPIALISIVAKARFAQPGTQPVGPAGNEFAHRAIAGPGVSEDTTFKVGSLLSQLFNDRTSIKKPKPTSSQDKIAGPGAADWAMELVIPKIPVPMEELTIKAVRPTRPIPFLFTFSSMIFTSQILFPPKKAEIV